MPALNEIIFINESNGNRTFAIEVSLTIFKKITLLEKNITDSHLGIGQNSTWQGHVESNHGLRFWRPLY